ncbi:MAG: DEAD/DEAH box helicase [Leptospirillum sp.]
MTTIYKVLETFRRVARSEREKGDFFERLMVIFFKADPLFRDRFENAWIWKDWPDLQNYDFDQRDTGIDLVAKEREGGYCAVQCKFFDSDHTIDKKDIDSFFTLSGKNPFTSRLIVSTTDKWSVHAEEALRNQKILVNRIGLADLEASLIDWSRIVPEEPDRIFFRRKKSLLPHQKEAVDKVIEGFRNHDRGKLIMACGTGKTFTSLRIAESLIPENGLILYLVPSIALVSQTLTEWLREAETPLRAFVVCSDTMVGKKKNDLTEDIRVHDLAYPATTDPEKLAKNVLKHRIGHRTIVFSTYQSIQVLHDAQERFGLPSFDLTICDEAHRTTGVTAQGEADSAFVAVHRTDFIATQKRLYMTATPRLYTDSAKSKARQSEIQIYSMDDPEVYGPEFHRLGFGEAVKNDLLTDYKVLVLVVDQEDISRRFPYLTDMSGKEISLPDAAKIIGCWNGLSKKMVLEDGEVRSDLPPMRRAVAFTRSIEDSKKIEARFSHIVDQYLESLSGEDSDEENPLKCKVRHVDGTFNILLRNSLLEWLKSDGIEENECRILSNARCLSEGVDVPALDSVIFMNPRDSIVDVVQSVGRVMRKSTGKDYGYIILPVVVSSNMEPEEALDKNENYRVVWTVLQALRAHDERLNAEINKLDLNKNDSDRVQVIGQKERTEPRKPGDLSFTFPDISEWREAIYARIVKKCGTTTYWESWANDVVAIAQNQIARIKGLLSGPDPHPRKVFNDFLNSLRTSINPEIEEDDAIEMLSQHVITKPVFDALFEGYSFTETNPVSKALQTFLDEIRGRSIESETEKLEGFYESVREKARGIKTAEGRQRVIVELYDKFFKKAFRRLAERLGIVYTPVEVVDFILRSADEVLRNQFGEGLTDPDVHILDPFAGTGTFLVRLLQSDLIRQEDMIRKYREELHTNEIILLAYYIASINIESTWHDLTQNPYEPFPGIVLTDTFQIGEKDSPFFGRAFLPENNERVARQKRAPIRVIVGNPPYSVGQRSENDNNKNLDYPRLDKRIEETYAKESKAVMKGSVYDSYIRAIRWASDRIGARGVIGFVTNASFIDSNATDGLRKCLGKEFSEIYCFNLRGNQRTSGEQSRKEGGKIFGSGSRTPVAITLFVKNPSKSGPCVIHYHDIGDYLSREQKLKNISEKGSIANVPWITIHPNTAGDWINQRGNDFEKLVPLGNKDSRNKKAIFDLYSQGVKTNRDSWIYNFSKERLTHNIHSMIDFYNRQVQEVSAKRSNGQVSVKDVDSFINNDPRKISWTRALKQDLSKGKSHSFAENSIISGMYRPFCKQWMYFDRNFNEVVYQIPRIFPEPGLENKVISVMGRGANKEFSVLITNFLPDYELISKGQCFPLYRYEQVQTSKIERFIKENKHLNTEFRRMDAVLDGALEDFRAVASFDISKEDIFHYVYGILHSLDFRNRFKSDLAKSLPRIPKPSGPGMFWAFSESGKQLALLHLNYESVDPWTLEEKTDGIIDRMPPKESYRVEKMRFGKGPDGKPNKRTIVYNSHLTLTGIPLEAYEYIVNGKSAIDWLMDRYQITINKDSGIKNDPNDWSDDPRYILDLVKRVVRVSLETIKIVNNLPTLKEKELHKGYKPVFTGGESIAAEVDHQGE